MSLGCSEWVLCLGLGRVGEDYESPLSCDHFYHRSVEVLFFFQGHFHILTLPPAQSFSFLLHEFVV